MAIFPNWKNCQVCHPDSTKETTIPLLTIRSSKKYPQFSSHQSKNSSRYESCLLTNSNTAALLPRGIQVVLRQSVDANLVIVSPCQESYCGNFSKLEILPGMSP